MDLPSTKTSGISSIESFFRDESSYVFNTHSLISPLHNTSLFKYQIVRREKGAVQCLITVPDGLFPGLIDTLTGLTDLFVAVQRKVKYFSAMHHPVDLQELEHQQEVQRNYSRDVIAAFEAYLGRGATENEAIRNTRADLSERYPFSMYEAVKDVLRKAGKFQKVRKRRRK